MFGPNPADLPNMGGCIVDIASVDGSIPCVNTCREVAQKMRDMVQSDDWIEVLVMADPDEETPRRPAWVKGLTITCLTYVSPDMLDKFETEIS